MRHRGLLQMSRGRSCREQQSSISAPSAVPAGAAVSAGGPARHPGAARNHRRRKPLHRLRSLSCAGSWCKPQVLAPDAAGPTPSVSALAADMLQRGWVTREEYAQLLLGDRLYCLHEAAQEEERQRKRGLTRKLSKKARPIVVNGMRVRAKTKKRKKTVGAVHAPKASVEKKAERPVAPSRDPITLDDLGSWTWDFRASEAATPPVSCGGPAAPKSGGGDASDRIGGGRGRRGRGRAEDGKGGCNAVVTYNVESLVLYLLESGDFQEPTTRRPFSLVQLADLDALAARAGAKVKGSLVKSYNEGQAKYRERRERREMLVGADRCLGDVVTEMLSTIEDSDDPHEEAHVYLVTLFPQFAHIFSELKEADEEFARQCLDQYRGTLRGPPNRPTLEQGGLLRTALEFLSEQGGADDSLIDSGRDGDFDNDSTGGVIGDAVDAEDEVEAEREDETETSSDDGEVS